MGLVAGYYSGRLYKTMKGKEWKVSQEIFETCFISKSCYFRLRPSSLLHSTLE